MEGQMSFFDIARRRKRQLPYHVPGCGCKYDKADASGIREGDRRHLCQRSSDGGTPGTLGEKCDGENFPDFVVDEVGKTIVEDNSNVVIAE